MQVDGDQDPDGNWHARNVGHTINGNWYPEGQYGKWYLDPEGVWHPTEASIQRQRQRERFNDPWSLVGSKKFLLWFLAPTAILAFGLLSSLCYLSQIKTP